MQYTEITNLLVVKISDFFFYLFQGWFFDIFSTDFQSKINYSI